MACRRLWSAWPGLLCWFLVLCHGRPAAGYITAPVPSLGQLTNCSTYITVVRVEKVEKINKDAGAIVYRKLHDLKGSYPQDVVRHVFDLKNTPQHKGAGDVPVRPDEEDWKHAVQWAQPGRTAVMFTLKYDPFGDFGHTYIDGCWYATMCPGRDWASWYAIYSNPDLLTRWHCGRPGQLAAAVEMVLAGREAALPVLAQGTKAELRAGRAKVQGLKIGLKLLDYNPTRDQACGVLDRSMVPSLVKSLQGPNRDTRAKAVMQLGLIGSPGDGASAGLLLLLRDKDVEVRMAALVALEQIGLEGQAVPALTEALKDQDPLIRRIAVRELGNLGPQARPALPDLAAMLSRVEAAERMGVAQALVRIDPENKPAGSFLGALLEDPKTAKETRFRAAEIIASCGAPAVPALTRALKDPEKEVRAKIVELLGAMGPAAKAAVPALAQTVADDASGTVRLRAAYTLPKLGPDAKNALPVLRAALNDPRLTGRKDVLAVIAETCKKLQP